MGDQEILPDEISPSRYVEKVVTRKKRRYSLQERGAELLRLLGLDGAEHRSKFRFIEGDVEADGGVDA